VNCMSFLTRCVLLGLGVAIWVGGTIYFGYRGHRVLETGSVNYWIGFAVSPLVSAMMAVAVLKLLRIAPAQWAAAALLLAIPGMIGEAMVLSHLSKFMPRIQESSGGRYGAFLFATYALVLGIAEIVTLKAGS